jgi:hypothetical protein
MAVQSSERRFADHEAAMGLSIKLAAAVSVASVVAGVAVYCGADEVLPAPQFRPIP